MNGPSDKGAASQSERTAPRDPLAVPLLVGGVIIGLLAINALRAVRVSDEIAGLTASLLAPLPALLHEARKSASTDATFPAYRGYSRPPAGLAAVTTSALFLSHVAFASFASNVALGLYVAAGRLDPEGSTRLLINVLLVMLIPECVLTFVIVRAMARRLNAGARAWAVIAVLLGGGMFMALVASGQHSAQAQLLNTAAIGLIARLGVGLAAAEQGVRTRLGYRLACQARQLPRDLQNDLRELLGQNRPAAAPPAFGSSAGGVGIGIVAGLTTFLIARSLTAPEAVNSTLAGGAALVPATLASGLARKSSPLDEFRHLVQGDAIRPIALTTFLTVAALLTIRNFVVQTSQYAAGGWLALSVNQGTLDPASARLAYGLVAYGLAGVATLGLGYLTLRTAADRLGAHSVRQLLWAVGIASASQIASMITLTATPNWLIGEITVFAGLAALAMMAARVAQRDAVVFALRHLGHRLAADDALAMAELIEEAAAGRTRR